MTDPFKTAAAAERTLAQSVAEAEAKVKAEETAAVGWWRDHWLTALLAAAVGLAVALVVVWLI